MIWLLRGAAALLLALPVTAFPATLSNEQVEAMDAILDKTLSGAPIPSLVVAIDSGGDTLYQRARGKANLSYDIPATVDTAYGIGSITKTFTGLAINQLVHAGKIDLQKPVTAYLPDYRGPGGRATVAHLLTHSSGIPSYNTEIPGIRQSLSRNAYTRESLVELFEMLPLNFEPGEKFSYSNSGYYLLGLIIEARSGKDYYEYLQEAVFDPLGMTRTYKGDLSEVVPAMARGYAYREGEYMNAPSWHYLVPFSAGSLLSTAADLITYRRGVFQSDAIPQTVRESLLQRMTLASGETNTYSLGGLVTSEFGGHPKISHAGDIWGYASNHAYYPREDLTIVLLSNAQGGNPALSSVEAKLARVLLGIPEIQIKQLTLDPQDLQRYAGDYKVHPFLIGFSKVGFSVSDGQLAMQFGGLGSGAAQIPLLAQGDGVFRASFDDEWVFYFEGDGARTDRITSVYRDGEIRMLRID